MRVYFIITAHKKDGKSEVVGNFEDFKTAEKNFDLFEIDDINSPYAYIFLDLVIDEDCLGDDIEDLEIKNLKSKWNDSWLDADVNYNDEELDQLLKELEE